MVRLAASTVQHCTFGGYPCHLVLAYASCSSDPGGHPWLNQGPPVARPPPLAARQIRLGATTRAKLAALLTPRDRQSIESPAASAEPQKASSPHAQSAPSTPSSPGPDRQLLALSARPVYTTHVPNATPFPEPLPCPRHPTHSRSLPTNPAAAIGRPFSACPCPSFPHPPPPRPPNRAPRTLSRPGQEPPHPTTCPPHAARAPTRPPQTPKPRQNAPRRASRVFWKKLLRARRRPIPRPRHPPAASSDPRDRRLRCRRPPLET